MLKLFFHYYSQERKLTLFQQKRTCLHIAALLGDDGIIRTLLKHGANPMCADTEGNIPAHLAAKWCSREENYADYKLVMTPLIQVIFRLTIQELHFDFRRHRTV